MIRSRGDILYWHSKHRAIHIKALLHSVITGAITSKDLTLRDKTRNLKVYIFQKEIFCEGSENEKPITQARKTIQ